MTDEKIYRDGAPIDCNSAGVPAEIKPREFWTNAPGHKHAVIGIWDSDNGAKAGTVCDLCLRWNEYEKLKAENELLKSAARPIVNERLIAMTQERDELRSALYELVSQHVRMDNGESKVFGHLIENAKAALTEKGDVKNKVCFPNGSEVHFYKTEESNELHNEALERGGGVIVRITKAELFWLVVVNAIVSMILHTLCIGVCV